MSNRVPTSAARVLLSVAVLIMSDVYAQTAKPHAESPSPLSQAKIQLAKHDLMSAEDSIWKILSSDPNNAEALLLLGTVRVEQQRYSEAETLFQRVVQLDPNAAAGHIALGRIYLAEDKLSPALEQYKQAEQLAPQNTEVHTILARLYAATGDCSLAMTSLEAIPPARFPPEAMPVKVGCLLALGHQEEATSLAERAKSPVLDLALAEVFVTSKLPQEALKLLDVAAASGKKPPARFYFVKAKALDESGNQAGALANFQRALALDPSSEEFALAMAELYARQGKHAEAFATLQKASKLDPDSPRILRPLIVEASFAGKSADAQDAAEQLAAKSNEPQDLYVAASVFLKTGRQNDAVPVLEKYVAQVPNDARAWVGLGIGYAELKRSDDAQKAFERALQVDPKFAEAEYQLGLLAGFNSDTAGATHHFERAVDLDPNHALALEKLGNLYLEAGQFEKARDALLKAESLNPNDRQTEYGLALAYSKLGNREEAKIHMERFQKFGPIGSTENK
jgi:tetratricopeptide (TPR) repeat protein